MWQKPKKIKVPKSAMGSRNAPAESPFVPADLKAALEKPVEGDPLEELRLLCNKYRLTLVKEYDESDDTIRLVVQKRSGGSHVAQTGWFDHQSEIPAKAQTLVPKVLEYARSYGLTINRETLI